MTSRIEILAAAEEPGLESLLYLLIFFVFPLLNTLGAWIRKRFGAEAHDGAKEVAGDPAEPIRQKPPRPAATVAKGRKTRRETALPDPARQPIAMPTRPMRRPPPLAKSPPTPPATERARPVPQPLKRSTRAKGARDAPPARPIASSGATSKTTQTAQQQSRSDRLHAMERIVERSEARERAVVQRDQPALLPRRLKASHLRSAVILSEILQPPLALREQDGVASPF